MSNVLNMVSEQTFVAQTNAIKAAIDAIGGGGGETGFDLLPNGAVTVTEGTFSVTYQGAAPAENTAKIILANKPYGIHDDVNFGVTFANGIASFSAGAATGAMTVAADCIVIIGAYAKQMTILGLPVNYGEFYGDIYEKRPTVTLNKSGGDWVGTLNAFPKNVSPAVGFTYDGKMALCDGFETAVYADCVIENDTVTLTNIPEVEFPEELNTGVLTEFGQCFGLEWVQSEEA